jgi:hypothetical protein
MWALVPFGRPTGICVQIFSVLQCFGSGLEPDPIGSVDLGPDLDRKSASKSRKAMLYVFLCCKRALSCADPDLAVYPTSVRIRIQPMRSN